MRARLWVVAALLTAAGCDDGGGATDGMGLDGGGGIDAMLDSGRIDGMDAADIPDAIDGMDAMADAMPDAMISTPDMAAPTCDWPAPMMGESPPARALAADPARCGAAPYAWRDDAELGAVVDRTRVQRWTAGALRAIARAADIDIPRPMTHDVVLEKVRYVTQDRGARVESTALVARPEVDGAPPNGMMALLHGTTGFSADCAPSSSLEYQALAAAVASTGYLVVAPDFLGLEGLGAPSMPLHPYLVGEPTAIATLDAVRAAGRLAADEGVCLAPTLVTLGISQGGHAALWTELLAPYYAAELTIAGTAAVVPPSDIVGQIERAISQRVDATANALGLLVAGGWWYGLEPRLGEVLQPPLAEALPMAARMSCDGELDLDEDDYPAPGDVFTDLVLDPARDGTYAMVEPWGCLARENSLLHTGVARLAPAPRPSHGVLFVLGERDTLVDTAIERGAFDALCEGGWPLVYLECEGAGHVPAARWSLPEVFDFLDARRAGEAVEGVCDRGEAVVCRGTPAE